MYFTNPYGHLVRDLPQQRQRLPLRSPGLAPTARHKLPPRHRFRTISISLAAVTTASVRYCRAAPRSPRRCPSRHPPLDARRPTARAVRANRSAEPGRAAAGIIHPNHVVSLGARHNVLPASCWVRHFHAQRDIAHMQGSDVGSRGQLRTRVAVSVIAKWAPTFRFDCRAPLRSRLRRGPSLVKTSSIGEMATHLVRAQTLRIEKNWSTKNSTTMSSALGKVWCMRIRLRGRLLGRRCSHSPEAPCTSTAKTTLPLVIHMSLVIPCLKPGPKSRNTDRHYGWRDNRSYKCAHGDASFANPTASIRSSPIADHPAVSISVLTICGVRLNAGRIADNPSRKCCELTCSTPAC